MDDELRHIGLDPECGINQMMWQLANHYSAGDSSHRQRMLLGLVGKEIYKKLIIH